MERDKFNNYVTYEANLTKIVKEKIEPIAKTDGPGGKRGLYILDEHNNAKTFLLTEVARKRRELGAKDIFESEDERF